MSNESQKKQLIIVTDGDQKAREAVQVAAENVGGHCILAPQKKKEETWGVDEIKSQIVSAPCQLVIVLVDDYGKNGEGRGESLLRQIAIDDTYDILGVVAVASNMSGGNGASVHASVTREGRVVQTPVGKDGEEQFAEGELYGDTVENLDQLNIPMIVGLGDPGKMDFADDAHKGAPVTTKALKMILNTS